tara:strand:+ start:1195 stop:1881 length:687 start_codon:yes stop_codon:yes gene_type:complete
MNNDFEILEKNIGYNFLNRDLLIIAITHPTYRYENNIDYDNQRLEYLGDSVWGMVIADYLYKKYTNHSEGYLTKLRSLYAREDALYEIATKINLGDFLLLGKGESKNTKLLKKSILADSFEAIIGAAWLDTGINGVNSILEYLLKNSILIINDSIIDDNPKGDLQEYAQKNNLNSPEYSLILTEGEIHSPTFTIKLTVFNKEFIGKGKSKKEAEKNAAKIAFDFIKND